ncbi:MAG: DNA replication/repair protein RecF [Candidatus Glassbacteria bacterium]|nr:DNA replication/repair protein RecF [Candidatus Glassbacteria bacterium]
MIIERLKLDNFRNLANTSLEFAGRGHLLVGDNGHGKTNLLEAIYYLTLLRSYRSSQDGDCISFGSGHFSVRGHWLDDQDQRENLVVGYDGRRKKVVLSGVEKKKVSEAFGEFKSVVISPDDIAIVQDGPSRRRRYLDIVLSLYLPGYIDRLKRYRRALSSRNVLLKKHAVDGSVIRPWEVEMAVYGSRLVADRLEFVGQLGPVYGRLFESLSGGENSALEYESDLLKASGYSGREAPDQEALSSVFETRLEEKRPQERERGNTLIGPQTDDLSFGLNGKPLRSFGSQGQQRTAVICLKMAEVELFQSRRGVRPVLLLDDIFSELDPDRSLRLLAELVERHQSFITAPRMEAVFDSLGHLAPLRVRCGVVEPM